MSINRERRQAALLILSFLIGWLASMARIYYLLHHGR